MNAGTSASQRAEERHPDSGEFEFHLPLHSGETEDDRLKAGYGIESAVVQDKTVVLRLASPWFLCSGAAPFTVSYTRPTEAGALKPTSGTNAELELELARRQSVRGDSEAATRRQGTVRW